MFAIYIVVGMILHHASLQTSVAGADWRVLRCRGRASCVRPVPKTFTTQALQKATWQTFAMHHQSMMSTGKALTFG